MHARACGEFVLLWSSQTVNNFVRHQCLHELRNCPYSGRLGVAKTQKAIDRLYWWKGVRTDVLQHTRHCSDCQKNKTNGNQTSGAPRGELMPLQIPGRHWESVSVDLITQLPKQSQAALRLLCLLKGLARWCSLQQCGLHSQHCKWHSCMCIPPLEHMHAAKHCQ